MSARPPSRSITGILGSNKILAFFFSVWQTLSQTPKTGELLKDNLDSLKRMKLQLARLHLFKSDSGKYSQRERNAGGSKWGMAGSL